MSFWSSLFGRKPLTFDETRAVIEEADRLASGDDPSAAMALMSSRRFKRLPRELVGPGGPLHGRLLAVMFKLKDKVVQSGSGVRKVERN